MKTSKINVLIVEPSDFSEIALQKLKDNFNVHQLSNLKDVESYLEDTDVLFIRLGIVFDKNLLQKAKKVQVICTPTTGLDHIDIEYCIANDIQIISLKGEFEFLGSIPSTAEHTFTLLNSVNRYLYLASDSVSNKKWDRNLFKSYNLHNKTLGLLGLGRVGKQVANYAIAFGMKVFAFDVNEQQKQAGVKNLNTPGELFSKADFISIHIPLVKENINYVNSELIKLMKPTACIINTSRGRVWDEQAIVEALKNHKIRGVATDVVYNEVEEDVFTSPIFQIDTAKYNCIITPHIAGATFDSMKMTEEFIVNKLINHVNA